MNSYLSNDQESEAIDLKKYKRKPVWPFAFILLPTVYVLFYGALVGLGILPPSITLGDYRIRFLGLFEGYMLYVSIVALLILPIVTVVCMILRASGNSQRALALDEAERRLHVESLYREGEEHIAEDTDVADTAEHESDAYGIPSVSTVTVAPDNSIAAFSYNNLRSIDSEHRSDSYDGSTVYNDELTLPELCNDFINYAAASGIKIPVQTARSIFSSMCASHVIWVSGKNKELTRRTLETLSSYFGAPLNIDQGGAFISTYDSVAIRVGKYVTTYSETPFLTDVYSANYTDNGIRFAAIENIKTADAERCLADYLNGADVVSRKRYARVAPVEYDEHSTVAFITGDRLRLYPNMWYIIIAQDSAPLPISAISLDLSAVSQNDSGIKTAAPVNTVSASRLYALTASAREANVIPEDYWKKIDALEAYIAGKTSYRLDNKSIRRIEAYTATAMAAGAELVEALDAAIAARMLPALAACPIESIQGDEDGIVAFIDRTFGIDNMPCSYECIRKLGVA